MANESDDMSAFAGEMQKLAQSGGFNPFSMLAGESRFHSVFLAPFSPSLKKHIAQFLADGTGPLSDVAKSLEQQGATPAEAQQQARSMFGHAQGMLIVVMAGDHGLTTIPQLNFGHLEDDYIEHSITACGEQFAAKDALKTAMIDLRAKAMGNTGWPALIAGPSAGSNISNYWLGLAASLIEGMDEGMLSLAGVGIERLRDLGFWIGSAVRDLGKPLDEDSAVLCARCYLIAGDAESAAAYLDTLLHDDADADSIAELIVHLSDTAIRTTIPIPAAAWLETFIPRFEDMFGKCYELRIARFKLLASAATPADKLQAAADALFAANKKSARQDLTREPIWRVVVEPGELLETAAAATLIDRSPTFVSKRLEQGTIPFYRQSIQGHTDQIRIPKTALESWFAIMQAHKLLE